MSDAGEVTAAQSGFSSKREGGRERKRVCVWQVSRPLVCIHFGSVCINTEEMHFMYKRLTVPLSMELGSVVEEPLHVHHEAFFTGLLGVVLISQSKRTFGLMQPRPAAAWCVCVCDGFFSSIGIFFSVE